jgi:hypothetical protein
MFREMSASYRWKIATVAGVFGSVLLVVAMTTCSSEEMRAISSASTSPSLGLDDYMVQATTNRRFYAQEEPITVTACISVLHNTRVSVTRNRRSDLNFELNIVNEQSETVRWTEEGIAVLNIKPSSWEVIVSPGNPFQESFRIDTWFELSKPGTYTLTVRKSVWARVGETYGFVEAIGGPVIFTRLPKTPAPLELRPPKRH